MLDSYFYQSGRGNTLDAFSATFGESIKDFASSTFGKVTLITAGITAAIAGIKLMDEKLNITYETSLKHTQESFNNATKIKSDIDSAKTEIDGYKDSLKEIGSKYEIDLSGIDDINSMVDKLNSSDKISLIDQAEISKIDSANSSLERTLELKNLSYTTEQKEAANYAKDTLNKTTKNRASTSERSLGNKYDKDYYDNMTNSNKYNQGTLIESTQTDLKAIKDYTDKIEELRKKKEKALKEEKNNKDSSFLSLFKKKDSEKIQKEIDDYSDEIDKIQSDVSSKQEDLSDLLSAFSVDGKGLVALSGFEKEFNSVKNAIDEINGVDLSPAEKALKNLNNYFDGSTGKNAIKDQLKDAYENGRDLETELSRMGLSLDNLGIDNISQLSDYFKDVASAIEEAKQSVLDYSSSVSDVTKAGDSANQDSNWSSIQSAYKSAKELLKEGKTGTDDFQSVASFLNPKKVKELADQGGKYTADAYQKAFEEASRYADRWFGDDETKSMENFVNDFKNKGLFDVKTDDMGLLDIQKNFSTTAEAADKFGMSVNSVETMLHGLEAYGYDFSDLMFSGESIDKFKTSLDSIKKIYDSMEDGTAKDRYGKLISNWDSELEGYENDMSSLTQDKVVKIQFEYDLATIQQKIDELQNTANEGGDTQTWAELNASKRQYREKSESREGNGLKDVSEYKQASDTITALQDQMKGQSDEVKEQIQEQISGIYDLQNAMNDAFADSNMSWDDWIGSDDYQQAITNMMSSTDEAKQKIADLLGIDVNDIKIDVDASNANQAIAQVISQITTIPEQTITELLAEDNASPEVINLLSDLSGIPESKLTEINATDGASGVLSYVLSVMTGVPESVITDMIANDNVSGIASLATNAINNVPQSHRTTLDGKDNVSGAANSAKSSLSGIKNKNVSIGASVSSSFLSAVSYAKNALASLRGGGGGGLLGTAHLGGTVYGRALVGGSLSNVDTSWMQDSWKTQSSEIALTGEKGKEIVVHGNKWWLTGEKGAEFTPIPAGSIIFNARQSKELLEKGFTNSRASGSVSMPGLAHVGGTAYRLGTSKSKKKSKKSSVSSGKSSRSTRSSRSGKSSSSGSSGSSSDSNSSKDTENLTDWIKIFLSRNSRLTDLSEDAIDRAVGLINKMSAATDTISKVNNEISATQASANKYLDYANDVARKYGISDDYQRKVQNGELSIENISNDNLREGLEKYQSYYESYLEYHDKVLDLQDKLTDLAEKRLEIIEKEYNSIEDIQTSLQDRLEADRDLLKSLGTAINNSLNVESLNESVKAQEEIYNQLTKKLADYQAEVDSQLKSGLMKQGSEQWYDAMKNINDFTANIAKASSELIELSDKLREIKYDTLQHIIDGFSRSTDKLSAYIDLLDARDEKVPEELYQQQIDNNNASIQKQYALREEKLKEQGLYDVGSERYQDLAEDISKADEEILKLRKDNEDLKDSIYELRISNLEKTIQGYSDLEDELKDMRDLLNDDAFLDKNGGITDEGLAQIALLSQSLGNAKKTIADYTTGLQKLKELYENGIISLDEYNDKSAEYRKGIREATSDVKSYQDSLTSLYTDALKAEVDALDKLIDKRKKALEAKEDYYNYDKKIRSQQKDVDTIKAQIAALTGVNDAASQAKLKKLKQDLTDAEDALSETQRDHRNDMISQGFSKISDDMADMLENVEYDISHNADKQLEIINSMLNKAVGSYQEAYNKINSIITNTGFVGSTDFNNNQSQLGSSEGVKNQVSNASQSQTEVNKNPSSSASGTITSPIKDNKAENDRITNDIMKPEDTTNRKVAELKVNRSSVSVQEGQGTTLTYTIRPNDAVNKSLSISYSAPTIATASATNGVISINGLRPGSVTVTISTTDGSNLSQTVNITVTKKPDPPKPAPAPSVNTSGGDGVPRVGDVVTFTGKYYNDSWGARPIGRLYSGVQGGVVIDGRSARAYGGSARRTGDYSVHIKSADGRYGDLGWVKLSQLSGYKDGTLGVADDEYAWTGEGYKSELIVRNDGAILTHMNKGDGVVPNPETLKLMKYAETLDANGVPYMPVNIPENSFVQEAIDGMKMAQSQNISNMKKLGNVIVENHYDKFLNVEGNVDKDALPGLQDILKKSCEYTMKEFAKDLRKKGFR